ncbi:MAG: putative quinol monooxygenase [Gemmatimonadales bacterium]
MVTVFSRFTMRRGKVPGALRLVRAVKRQAEIDQAGTLVYLVHRVLDKSGKPGRELAFYECYRNPKALTAHLDSTSWRALVANWDTYFEGSSKKIAFFSAKRIGAFARRGAIPAAKRARG